ncbi:oligosaccharide flippase family protein [Muribaculum intestinale]|uniref:Polysaccharide biosynthesis protein C-terminal domain-containing protein n=1 Tax=Muribaculum intestinale TaxID=1796646 RepID=A0A4S2G3B5_9BACT|nr:oligosaccharide flippase family protein [Muribaculum intestinale]MYM11054.1 oligosaccharide flippase family protein [Muribaculum intestinale]TGY76231.1 hypothetical protein E5333_01480 [Muribaculum intestinale]
MKGASIDALLLTIVRVITMVMGFVCIKIVSVYFSLESFGLYSQALLIISTTTSLSILGMTDAVNYFYNNKTLHAKHSSEEYIATIFGLQTFVGIVCGIAILAGAPFLTDYFQNSALWSVYGWIAFQPILQNYISMLQVLYMSAGRARSIVIINLIISLGRLAIFIAATFVTHNIVTILALTFISDIIQVSYFSWDLHKHGISINLKKFNKKICRPILVYAIPMAAFVIINSLMRDADKWVIGYFASTDDLAIYTNCSKLLPFDMLTYSFCVVLVPVITRYINTNKEQVALLYGDYLNIGLFTTSILVIPALFLSRDLLLCLYDSKYLPGLLVFIIYLLVDFSRFANVSLLYSASGKSVQLLRIVIFTFVINTIGAIILYQAIGLTGPAIATLISLWISYIFYLKGSSNIMGRSVLRLFNVRGWLPIALECSLMSLIAIYLSSTFMTSWNAVPRFLLMYTIITGCTALLNKKKILVLAQSINKASKYDNNNDLNL